jgi:hypothetical protein
MADEAKGYVSHATLTTDALVELLTKRFNATAQAIVRRVDAAEFVMFDPNHVDEWLNHWSDGQIFDHEAELRWHQSKGAYSVLLLTENNNLFEDFHPLAGSPFVVTAQSFNDTHGFLLWGTTRNEEGWIETRIPRLLQYPMQAKKKPQLSYRLYQERMTVRWVRFTGLKEAI